MAEAVEDPKLTAAEYLASGRRNLAIKDYFSAAEDLSRACEAMVEEHGPEGDKCAEVHLWYGKALLGLAREETGVFGDKLPKSGNADEDQEDDDEDENGDEENGDAEAEASEPVKENGTSMEPESTTKEEEPASSTADDGEQPATSNGEAGEANEESTIVDEDDLDNLQLAWENLDLARSILSRRVSALGSDAAARALLADAHLALGEVALESETYDKAVIDMQSCLDLQKELYSSDDRRIAETHYQIGLANSLASNFDDAVTHFKNAANILESRIKTLEDPTSATNDATVKKYTTADPSYSVAEEIVELKELLPEIREKIHDVMDMKAETRRRVSEALLPSNGTNGAGSSSSNPFNTNGAGSSSSSSEPKPAATNISHLIKRKRKSSEGDASAAKRANT